MTFAAGTYTLPAGYRIPVVADLSLLGAAWSASTMLDIETAFTAVGLGTVWSGVGTAGNVLTSNGAGTAPSWQAAGGASASHDLVWEPTASYSQDANSVAYFDHETLLLDSGIIVTLPSGAFVSFAEEPETLGQQSEVYRPLFSWQPLGNSVTEYGSTPLQLDANIVATLPSGALLAFDMAPDWKTVADARYIVGPGAVISGDIVLFSGTTGLAVSDSGKQFSTDGTMAANSDALVPTQKAVVTYVASQASTGSFPAVLEPTASVTLTQGQLYFTGSGPMQLDAGVVVTLNSGAFVEVEEQPETLGSQSLEWSPNIAYPTQVYSLQDFNQEPLLLTSGVVVTLPTGALIEWGSFPETLGDASLFYEPTISYQPLPNSSQQMGSNPLQLDANIVVTLVPGAILEFDVPLPPATPGQYTDSSRPGFSYTVISFSTQVLGDDLTLDAGMIVTLSPAGLLVLI